MNMKFQAYSSAITANQSCKKLPKKFFFCGQRYDVCAFFPLRKMEIWIQNTAICTGKKITRLFFKEMAIFSPQKMAIITLTPEQRHAKKGTTHQVEA
jgi:hypothetical protein